MATANLVPTSQNTAGGWTDEAGGTTNLHLVIDETSADTAYLRGQLNAITTSGYFGFDYPADATGPPTAVTLNIRHSRGGVEGGDAGGGDDTFTISFGIMNGAKSANLVSPITVETGTVGYTVKTENIVLTGIAGTLADWDGALMRFGNDFSQNMAADGDRIWIDFVNIDITYPAGTVVTPATVNAPAAVPAPTITYGGDPAPATVNAPAAVPAPTVTVDDTVSPATIDAPAAIPTVALTVWETVTPATVAAPAAIPGPTVEYGGALSPATINAPAAVPAATAIGSTSDSTSPATITARAAIPGVAAYAISAVAYYGQTDGSYTSSGSAIPLSTVTNGFAIVMIVGAPDTSYGYSPPANWTVVEVQGDDGSGMIIARHYSGAMDSSVTIGTEYGTWQYQTYTFSNVVAWEYGSTGANSGVVDPPSKTASTALTSNDMWVGAAFGRDLGGGANVDTGGWTQLDYRYGTTYILNGCMTAGTGGTTANPGQLSLGSTSYEMWGAATFALRAGIAGTSTPATVNAPAAVPSGFSIAAGAGISPATITVLAAVPLPSVAIAVSPATVTAVAEVPLPALTYGGDPAPATITVLAAVPLPSVTIGFDHVATTINIVASVPAPTVTYGWGIAPVTITVVASVPTPELKTWLPAILGMLLDHDGLADLILQHDATVSIESSHDSTAGLVLTHDQLVPYLLAHDATVSRTLEV